MQHTPWQVRRLQEGHQGGKKGTVSALVGVEDLASVCEVEDFATGVVLEGI